MRDSTTDKPEDDTHQSWCEHRRIGGALAALRQKLYLKAKQEPTFRFYALYDRIYRNDTLAAAWQQVRRNGGSPGIDGVTIEQIVRQEGGPELFLNQLQEALRTKRYKPDPVKRTYIPKPDGRLRPLGIPTIRDRVVQMATLLILEPIFEADFHDCSFGFRPGRNAHQALEVIRGHLKAGYREVYDADLEGYFDSIPHDKLITGLKTRIIDGRVLKLIRMWLNAPVVEKDKSGKTKVHRPEAGTPQGGVISPLLANLYLHWFDRAFHGRAGPAQWAKAKLVRYADDFVVLARYQGTHLTAWIEDILEGRCGLTINREKTAIRRLNQGDRLDFLGYTFRYHRDLKGRGYKYLHVGPSEKALARERDTLRELTSPRLSFVPAPVLIERINRHLRGWANYFSYGYPSVAYREINSFVRARLTRHLQRRSQRPFRPPEGETYYKYLQRNGLIYLSRPA